jgi:predicted HD phosphohydrolase
METVRFTKMADGTEEEYELLAAYGPKFTSRLPDRLLRALDELKEGGDGFDACAEFCEKYDQASFDPDYDSLPVEHFQPMVRRVFSTPRYGTHASREDA